MLISTRRAADILSRRVATYEQARHLLRCGAAGPSVQIGRALGYDETRVRELAARPWTDELRLASACPWGVHVARLSRARTVDAAAPWDERARDLSVQPALPTWAAALLAVRMEVSGGLPWVATVSGFVVFGGEARGWRRAGDAIDFDLEPPGPWYDAIDRTWFGLAPGRPWFLWQRSSGSVPLGAATADGVAWRTRPARRTRRDWLTGGTG